MCAWTDGSPVQRFLTICEVEKQRSVGTVMSNRKDMPKQAFSEKLKKGKKISCQRDHLLAIKWKDIRDVFFLTTAHEDVLVAPS